MDQGKWPTTLRTCSKGSIIAITTSSWRLNLRNSTVPAPKGLNIATRFAEDSIFIAHVYLRSHTGVSAWWDLHHDPIPASRKSHKWNFSFSVWTGKQAQGVWKRCLNESNCNVFAFKELQLRERVKHVNKLCELPQQYRWAVKARGIVSKPGEGNLYKR